MSPAPRSSAPAGIVGGRARVGAPRGPVRSLVAAGATACIAACMAGCMTGCIIPDAGIVVEDEFRNAGAVRIVEPTPVTDRAHEACEQLPGIVACPQLPDTLPSGLIRPDVPLCVCPSGRDEGLGNFDVFVEDPDVDDEGNPRDDILGALFLDLPFSATDPRPYLAYTSQLPPDEPAPRFRAGDVQTIERPDPHLKAWSIDSTQRIDLCNDNDGTPVSVGLHELRLIVTDRPWYSRVMRDAEGAIVLDEEGQPVIEEVAGMPDLAAGATYDTVSYVFQCFDANDPPEGIQCSCETV